MSKKGHGHHGGAWKVAYADFVTAMMALFLTLWLTAQDEKIKEAVERAFRHPFSSVTKESVGILPNKESTAVKADGGNFDADSAIELKMLRRLNDDLLKILKNDIDEAEETVKLEMVGEGLRISIFDHARRAIFEPDTAQFTEYGRFVVEILAWQVALYKGFAVEVEGHTEQGFKPPKADYTSWELSSDRANTARRLLVDHGVNPPQIAKVAGYSDTMPMPHYPPTDESNRRVVVMLRLKNAHRDPDGKSESSQADPPPAGPRTQAKANH